MELKIILKCLQFGFEKCNVSSIVDVKAVSLADSASILAQSADWHLEHLELDQNMKKEQLVKQREFKDKQGLVRQGTF